MERLTACQVGRVLGVDERFVYRLIKHGFLPSTKWGRQHFISQEELLCFRERFPTLPKLPPQYKRRVRVGLPLTMRPEYKEARLQKAKELASKKDGVCLSDTYSHSHKNLRWRCGEGHEWEAPLNRIMLGRWCQKCLWGSMGHRFQIPPKAQPSRAV